MIVGDINTRAGQDLVAGTKIATGNQSLHFIKLDVTDWPSQVSFFRKTAKLSPHGAIARVVAHAEVSGAEESASIEKLAD